MWSGFLPFGLRTAPYLFNLFTEVFHWILDNELKALGLLVHIIYYLDDFLLILPPVSMLEQYLKIIEKLCVELVLSIKQSKNKEGSIASFAGWEIDTKEMVIRLSEKKLQK